MENNINKKIVLIVLSILFIYGILIMFVLDIHCAFKAITGIACPFCGLTRGFRALLCGSIIQAEKYNVLTIPMFLFLLTIIVLFVQDIIRKDNKMELFLKKVKDNYLLIIVLIAICYIINIVRGI